jgi:hypothetical protein
MPRGITDAGVAMFCGVTQTLFRINLWLIRSMKLITDISLLSMNFSYKLCNILETALILLKILEYCSTANFASISC